jgi:hypothetical protein
VQIIARIIIVVDDLLLFGDLIVFIVPGKDDHGRMIAESTDSLFSLDFDAIV